ncbi:hypothetical protein F1880_005697 [Penicillium rolfsii]|nr:hypothetical protein F1880_005697 [Penicillium rolfsii]
MANLALKSLALLSFLVGASATSKCYYPNGDEAVADTPCYSDGRITHCCGSNSICLTNQLCLSLEQPYGLSRGSCTDRSFGSSCPSYCKNAQEGSGASLVWFTNGTTGNTPDGEPTEYCCNSVIVSSNNTLVCSSFPGTVSDPFPIANGSVIADVAGLIGLVKQSSTSSSPTIANNTGNDDTPKSSTHSEDSQKDTAIGAGVGVPLGVISLLSIGWAVYERRMRKKIPHAQAQSILTTDYSYGFPRDQALHNTELAELTAEHKPTHYRPVEL